MSGENREIENWPQAEQKIEERLQAGLKKQPENKPENCAGMSKQQAAPGEAVPVRLIQRRLVRKGSVLDIYDDEVEVNGHRAHWDFIHHNGAAAVLPVQADGRILMVRQYRHALGRFTLELPAGKLDSPEESMRLCAARELEEETGYRAGRLEHLIDVNTTVAFCDEFIGIYLARDLEKTEQHLDEDEDICVESWTLSDLLKLIFNRKMTDGKTVAAILAYAALLHQESSV